MKEWKKWDELTLKQQDNAKEQYRTIEEETDELYGRCETCCRYGKCIYCENCDEGSEYKLDTSDNMMSCLCGYEIDTEDEEYIFVNI